MGGCWADTGINQGVGWWMDISIHQGSIAKSTWIMGVNLESRLE